MTGLPGHIQMLLFDLASFLMTPSRDTHPVKVLKSRAGSWSSEGPGHMWALVLMLPSVFLICSLIYPGNIKYTRIYNQFTQRFVNFTYSVSNINGN